MGWFQPMRLFHWGPILALAVITLISISSINCMLQWWPPLKSFCGTVHFMVYMWWNATVLYNFFNAAFVGPGHVPYGWKPENEKDTELLQYCVFCKGYKVPRSHHCRKCGRCVMKMDHHCPWINNCVGHKNHACFTYFLFYAPVGCIHSLCVLIPSMYRAVNRHYYLYYGDGTEPIVNLSVQTFIGCMFSVGLAIGVIVAVGALLYIQVKTILRNETGIESWIIEKAYYRDKEEGEDPDAEFVFPYHLGRWENWKLVFSFSPDARLDGIWWPVREDCDQYTLTVEQVKQKREKKERSVVYEIREKYSGAIFPITKGLRVCCCPPFTDEPRIPLVKGDRVLVSRWKKHWLYGDKLLPHAEDNGGVERVRGWFPRKCAMEPAKKKSPPSQPQSPVLPNNGTSNSDIRKRPPAVPKEPSLPDNGTTNQEISNNDVGLNQKVKHS